MAWNVEYYVRENGEQPVTDFLEQLPPKLRAKALRAIDLLEEFGSELTLPHARPIKGHQYKGLWELRSKFASDITRVFYFMPYGDTFILLHGFVKQGERTPTTELDRAKKYMDDFLRRLHRE